MREPEDKNAPDSLRDIFQQSQTKTGGDTGVAFITILDELDVRMRATDALAESNRSALKTLAGWYRATDTTLAALPEELSKSVTEGLRRAIPELTASTEEKAAVGAKIGAQASQEAIQELRSAIDHYDAKRRKLTNLLSIVLPTILCATAFIGFLFASFVIPALPPTEVVSLIRTVLRFS